MARAVELPVDDLSYKGFAQMLYDILEELGVPTKQVKYVYRGEPRPNDLQGHIIIHLRVPLSKTLPKLHAI